MGMDPRDLDDVPPTGGFHASQRRTLLHLAWACLKNDIAEVQRLAAMTLTWGGHGSVPGLADQLEEALRALARHDGRSWCAVCGFKNEECDLKTPNSCLGSRARRMYPRTG